MAGSVNVSMSSLGLVTLYVIAGSFAALVSVLLSVSATTHFYSAMVFAVRIIGGGVAPDSFFVSRYRLAGRCDLSRGGDYPRAAA